MASQNPFIEKLRSKRAELDAVRSKLTVLETEVRVWEEAARLLEASDYPEAEFKRNDAPKQAASEDDAGHRRLRFGPKKLLTWMASQYPQPSSLDALKAAAAKLEIDMSRGAIRSLMGGYVGRRYVDRVSEGVFRITLTGAEAAEVTLSNRSENNASPDEPSQHTREAEGDANNADVDGESQTDLMPPSGSAEANEPSFEESVA